MVAAEPSDIAFDTSPFVRALDPWLAVVVFDAPCLAVRQPAIGFLPVAGASQTAGDRAFSPSVRRVDHHTAGPHRGRARRLELTTCPLGRARSILLDYIPNAMKWRSNSISLDLRRAGMRGVSGKMQFHKGMVG